MGYLKNGFARKTFYSHNHFGKTMKIGSDILCNIVSKYYEYLF